MKSFVEDIDTNDPPTGGGSPYYPTVFPTLYPIGPVNDLPPEPSVTFPTVVVNPTTTPNAPIEPSPVAAVIDADDDFEIDETTLLIGGSILAAVLLLK